MKGWQRLLILLLVILLPSEASWALAGGLNSSSKDLVLVARSSAQQIEELQIKPFNNKIPTLILLLVTKRQKALMAKKHLEYEIIHRNYVATPDAWFINSADVCSPCFTNIVNSFAKILWKSSTNFLVTAEIKNIRYILNNQDGKVVAYNLGPEQTVLNAGSSDADNKQVK